MVLTFDKISSKCKKIYNIVFYLNVILLAFVFLIFFDRSFWKFCFIMLSFRMNLLLTVTFEVKDTTRPTLPVLGQVHIVSVHGFPVGIRGDGHFDFYVFTLVLPDFITIGKTVPSLTDLREIKFCTNSKVKAREEGFSLSLYVI